MEVPDESVAGTDGDGEGDDEARTNDRTTASERRSGDDVRSRYGDVVEQIARYEESSPERAAAHRRRAEELLADCRAALDDAMVEDLRDVAGGATDDGFREHAPFHWVLEFAHVHARGGFDVVVGNPPWDRLRPTRDDFFVRYDGAFPSLPPEDKDARQAALLDDETVAEEWERYRDEIQTVTDYFHGSEAYRLQTPTVGGQTHGTENDLCALFLERVFQLATDGGYVAQVLPGAIFNGASTTDLRTHLLDETTITALVTFENRGVAFPEIHNQYNFGVIAFRNGGRTESLPGTFQQVGMECLDNFEDVALEIPRRVLRDYSPEARIVPYLQSRREVDVLDTILAHPPVGDDSAPGWHARLYRELDRTNDADRLVADPAEGDYPVYGGSNVYQFSHDPSFVDVDPPEFRSVAEDVNPDASAKRRIREKNVRTLKRALYRAFDGTGSQTEFVNDLLEQHRGRGLSEEDVLLDCTTYRIVVRDVARASDERTVIAAVIPPGVVCTNTLHTVRPYEIAPEREDLRSVPLHSVYERVFTDRSLFATLGLLNSVPFDYLLRTKVDSHVVMYKFEESQVPRLTAGDEWFEYIWRRAARLNCYGEAFAEMRDRLGGLDPVTDPDEREAVQAELDAAAFHAYGLDRDRTAFVLDDFHRVRNPRRMTEAYFDLVLEKYEELNA